MQVLMARYVPSPLTCRMLVLSRTSQRQVGQRRLSGGALMSWSVQLPQNQCLRRRWRVCARV